jgi:hypothetical protein
MCLLQGALIDWVRGVWTFSGENDVSTYAHCIGRRPALFCALKRRNRTIDSHQRFRCMPGNGECTGQKANENWDPELCARTFPKLEALLNPLYSNFVLTANCVAETDIHQSLRQPIGKTLSFGLLCDADRDLGSLQWLIAQHMRDCHSDQRPEVAERVRPANRVADSTLRDRKTCVDQPGGS